ncbi:DUF948 domain-containing protein [Propionicicella superfundia]|uniref:DUF948 domain-containing protein n=1 Tax=Propionicicella superfundia TaxID=348582 RepID=UPI0004151D34|nr:DUF948 domain-containing protein [Propionicicella superfundia]
MSVGEIAGLIAALAAVVFVALCAVPLFKTGRVLEELRLTIRDVGHNTVPILQELKGTVTATNDEISKVAVVTEDVTAVTRNVTVVTDNAAKLATVVNATLGGPLVKGAAFVYGVRSAVSGKKPAKRSAK